MPPVGNRSGSCYDDAASVAVENENENEVNINIDVDVNDSDSSDDGSGSGDKKVELCHNGETIEVSVNALEAHYGHDDTLGPCSTPIVPEAPVEPVVEPVVPEEPAAPDPVAEPTVE